MVAQRKDRAGDAIQQVGGGVGKIIARIGLAIGHRTGANKDWIRCLGVYRPRPEG